MYVLYYNIFLGGNISCIIHCILEQYNIAITTPPGPTADQSYTLTCEVDVGEGTPTLQWTGPGGMAGVTTMGQSGTTFTLTLTFSPLSTSDGGLYACQSTVGSGAVVRTANTIVNVLSK